MKNNNWIIQVTITAMLAVITIMATYMIVDTKTSNVANLVVAKMLAIEYDKVGGKENYIRINEIQKSGIIEGLKQYDTQNGGAKAPTVNNQAKTNPAPTPSGNTLSLEDAKKITGENTYILGNPDAEITWIEYSDLECPFCKKLHQSGTIEEIMKAYDGKVNFIFKQFSLSFHPQAPMEAEAALCVGDLAGKDKYYEFITETFNNSKANGRSYTKESISKLGSEIGLDEKALLSCIESGKFKAQAQAEMKEGASIFGVTGTPGNVLINNKTGEWDILSGAYPAKSFKEKIDSLLK